jgi:hypothetical protein
MREHRERLLVLLNLDLQWGQVAQATKQERKRARRKRRSARSA